MFIDSRPPARDPRRAARILANGLDLTGKTTLTAAIIAAVGERGVPAVPHCGILAGHYPLERRLRRTFPLVRQPDSSLVTSVFLLGAFPLDRVLAAIDPPQRVSGYARRFPGRFVAPRASPMAFRPRPTVCALLRTEQSALLGTRK